MIKVSGLNKYYNKGKPNEIHVINDMNFELPDVGIVAFLGQSGSGKTTLLNVIGGLDSASGEIDYGDYKSRGKITKETDEFRRKHVGVVFQNYNLLKDETVLDNLRIALELIGVTDPEEIEKRSEYTLKAVGMYKYRKKKAYALSGGQQQRVAIARALLKNCKVLIADEPTGNLDSENTAEIMNILRNVSKTALVLLVTHDENLASHYADHIFRITDGRIASRERNVSSTGRMGASDSSIYLGDMNEESATTSVGEIKIYSEDEKSEANLTLILKNGTIYLSSDIPVKLASESGFKIKEGRQEEINREEETEYDSSFYVDAKSGAQSFKKALGIVKNTYARIRPKRKRTMGLYVAMFALGIMFCIVIISLMIFTEVDTSQYSYSGSYSSFRFAGEHYSGEDMALYGERFFEMYERGAITHPVKVQRIYANLQKQITYSNKAQYYLTAQYVPYYEDMTKLRYGEAPVGRYDVVVSDNIAEELRTKLNAKNPEDVIGEKFVLTTNTKYEYTVTGISYGDQYMCYMTLAGIKALPVDYDYYYRDGSFKDIRQAAKEVGPDSEKLYSVTEGRDVNAETSDNEAIAPESAGIEVGQTVSLGEKAYKVVGKFTYPFETKSAFIINKEENNPVSEIMRSHSYVTNETDFVITEGRMPNDKREAIVSAYSRYNVGDTIQFASEDSYGERNLRLTVVGKYTGSTDALLQNVMVSYDTYAAGNISPYYSLGTIFKAENPGAIATLLGSSNYECNSMYANMYLEDLNSKMVYFMVFAVIAGIVFTGCVLFMYFAMRSRMLNDIKTIGIYRCIGSRKGKIVGRYALDSLFLCLITAFAGYAIAYIAYYAISVLITGYLGSSILAANALMFWAFAPVLIILNVFFGVLPVLLLLRKTPAEICAKYDI